MQAKAQVLWGPYEGEDSLWVNVSECRNENGVTHITQLKTHHETADNCSAIFNLQWTKQGEKVRKPTAILLTLCSHLHIISNNRSWELFPSEGLQIEALRCNNTDPSKLCWHAGCLTSAGSTDVVSLLKSYRGPGAWCLSHLWKANRHAFHLTLLRFSRWPEMQSTL